MINRIRKFLTFFVILTTFASALPMRSFAVNDIPLEMELKKTPAGIFYVDTPDMLSPWPMFFSDEGDMDINISNPFCLGYAALYFAAMYKGNTTVRLAATAALVLAVTGIYIAANIIYSNYEICGVDWLTWGTNANTDATTIDIIKYYPVKGAFKGSKKYDTLEIMKKGEGININNQAFRQYLYNGEEVINTICTDPRPERAKYDIGGTGQTYYMRGYDVGNYACERFNEDNAGVNESRDAYKKAYDCCVKASNSVCLTKTVGSTVLIDKAKIKANYDSIAEKLNFEFDDSSLLSFFSSMASSFSNFANVVVNGTIINMSDYENLLYRASLTSGIVTLKEGKFCNAKDKLCTKAGIIFEVFKGQEQPGVGEKYCMRTWSLCPYNFNIQKGSEQYKSFTYDIESFEFVEYRIVKDKETGIQRIITSKENPKDTEDVIQTIENTDYTLDDECADPETNISYSCKGKPKNFYQLNRHCTLVREYQPFPKDEIEYAPFIDKSCINLIGSSHNTPGYKPYYSYLKNFNEYKSFSAPIVECITETLKNFMLNRAGHTRCAAIESSGELITKLPSADGKEYCGPSSSYYEYQMGDDLATIENSNKVTMSPIVKLLSRLQGIIIVASTLMVAFYGINLMMKGAQMDRKGFTIAGLKLIVVLAFSASSWWYDLITEFTYSTSRAFTEIVNRFGLDNEIDEKGNYIRFDGCYFGNPYNFLENREDDISNVSGRVPDDVLNNNYFEYPRNRRYVSFFDTLDCKVAKYLGYSAAGSDVKLITTLALSLLISAKLLYIAVGTIMIALFAINFAFTAAYIFIASNIAITIMLYVAPLVIPCILFEKTKGIFSGWLTKIIGYCIYPVMLFTYISIGTVIMDKYVLGEGIFTGDGLTKQLVCGYACRDGATNNIIEYDDKYNISVSDFEKQCTGNLNSSGNNDEGANKFINITEASVLCFMKEISGEPWSLFFSLGINLFVGGDFINRLLALMIMFIKTGFLFFILTKVLATIPGIAGHITGASLVNSEIQTDPFVMGRKVLNLAKGATRAVSGAAGKAATAANSIKEKAKGAIKKAKK